MTLCKGLDGDSREWILYLPRQCELVVLIAMGIVVVVAAVIVSRHLTLVICGVVSLVVLLCVAVGGIFAAFACASFALGWMLMELTDRMLDAVGARDDLRFNRPRCDKK
jgi:hypothetical protein